MWIHKNVLHKLKPAIAHLIFKMSYLLSFDNNWIQQIVYINFISAFLISYIENIVF